MGGLSYPSIDDCLQEKREDILSRCKHLLPKKWLCGDYKDLVELTIIYMRVKLANDFLQAIKHEEAYQNVLQVVENDRKEVPNQRKKNQ